MHKVWIIAANIVRQLLRNRILVVLSLCAIALVGVVAFLGDLGQEAELRLGRDFGLLAVEAVGFFTVLLCHVVLLFEESELKTYNILLVRPLRRSQVLGGRVLGAVLLMLLNQAGMILLLLGLGAWRGLRLVDADFLVAAAYLSVGGAFFSAVTAFFSVLASSVPAAAMFSTFAWTLGHFTANLEEWSQRLPSGVARAAVRMLYWLTPNFSLFNLKENLEKVGSSFSLQGIFVWPLLYALLYGACLLTLALWRYERKDF
jgi:ABC-type transport system involved in multi-copper enzyme maturation permease subunit